MKLDKRRDEIQKQALDTWLKNNKKGTCVLITGLGKTFISLHALYEMPRNDDTHLFLAETLERERDVRKDIEVYNKIFNRNVLEDYNLEFNTYQTAYKWRDLSFGLIILDEVHEIMTPAYSKFLDYNHCKALLGLTASPNKEVIYRADTGLKYSKNFLYSKYCPIIYNYSLHKAKVDGTRRSLKYHVIYTELNAKDKLIKAGNKKNVFYQTEQAAYDYWDKIFNNNLFMEGDPVKREKSILYASYRRRMIIWNSVGKLNGAKKLLKKLKNKSIIFSDSLDLLNRITPNTLSYKKSDDENKRIRDLFEKGNINVIGSSKKLKQGANLSKDLDNLIMLTYTSSTLDLIQRIGRLRDNGKEGNVFIFLTPETREEIWYNKMISELGEEDINYYSDISELLKKIDTW